MIEFECLDQTCIIVVQPTNAITGGFLVSMVVNASVSFVFSNRLPHGNLFIPFQDIALLQQANFLAPAIALVRLLRRPLAEVEPLLDHGVWLY